MSSKPRIHYDDEIEEESSSSDSSSDSDSPPLPELGNMDTLFEGHCASDVSRYGWISSIMFNWVSPLIQVLFAYLMS